MSFSEWEIVVRLLLATVLGASVGWQRERRGKPAGLRTNAIIALGAALFTVISIYGFGGAGDLSRVAAGVVAGIGFLGAGTILHRGSDVVEGLTTAATIWTVAALGVAVGTGLYLAALAAFVLIMIVLFIPHHMAK